jgi:hypothetical protein
MEWIGLVLDRNQWRAPFHTAMDLPII